MQHVLRADPMNPHHCRCGVAYYAPRPPAVRGGDDRGQIADMHLRPEQPVRHLAAYHGGRYVVDEAPQPAHDHEKPESALPVIREDAGYHRRYAALLEM